MTCAGLRTDLTADPEKPLRTSVLPQKTVSIGLDSESFTVAHSTPFFEYVNPRCTFYSQRDRHGVKSVSSAPKYVIFGCVQTGPRTQANRFFILKTSLGICTYAVQKPLWVLDRANRFAGVDMWHLLWVGSTRASWHMNKVLGKLRERKNRKFRSISQIASHYARVKYFRT